VNVFVTTPPAPVVTWEEADAHLRLEGDEDQRDYVERLIAAATAHIDGPTGWLGRAIGPQTLLAEFVCAESLLEPLPFPPFIDVVDIQYVDTNGQVQTWAAENYQLIFGRIMPAVGAAMPTVYSGASGCGFPLVRVRYRAGYAADPLADPLVAAVPETIKQAILLMVGDMFRFRETASSDGGTPTAVPMSATVEALLAPLRRYS
jgi:uncharacterized phiE125 gp8 family phage protein